MQMMQFPSGCYRQLVLCLLQASCYTSKLLTFTLLCKRLFSDVLINVDVGNTSKTISRSENHLKDILAKENDPALLQMTASVIGNLALRLVNSTSSRWFSLLIGVALISASLVSARMMAKASNSKLSEQVTNTAKNTGQC